MASMPQSNPSTYRTLDAWRGVASFWVVTFHANATLIPRFGETPAYLAPFASGYLGVQMFFVISGYCIAGSALSCSRKPRPTTSYLLARTKRIFPAYWASFAAYLAAAVLAEWLIARGTIKSSYLGEFHVASQPTGFFLHNLMLTAPYFRVPLLSVVAWTLCYEISFYAIVACAMGCFRKRTDFFFSSLHLLTIGCCTANLLPPAFHVFPLDMWPQFGLGVIIYDYYTSADRRRAMAALTTTLLLMIFYAGYRSEPLGYAKQPGQTTVVIAVAFALTVFLLRPWDARIAEWRLVKIFSGMGAWSYSLYLVNFLAIGLISQVIARAPSLRNFRVAAFCLSIFGALVFGYAFYRCFERPFLKNSRKMAETAKLARPTETLANVEAAEAAAAASGESTRN